LDYFCHIVTVAPRCEYERNTMIAAIAKPFLQPQQVRSSASRIRRRLFSTVNPLKNIRIFE